MNSNKYQSSRSRLAPLLSPASARGWQARFGMLLSLGFFAAMINTPIPAMAQSVTTPFGGFANNSDEPIDIEADELQIKQKQNTAVFKGKVRVIQGKLTLKSAKLVVYYKEVKKNGEKKQEISKLDASGGVIVTSKTQSATGDWAKMDVKKNNIVMGDNVVLSQGNNVIRGSKILVDLNTGYSRVLSDKKKGERVRAIFKSKKK